MSQLSHHRHSVVFSMKYHVTTSEILWVSYYTRYLSIIKMSSTFVLKIIIMEFQLTTLNEMTLISFNLFYPPPPRGCFLKHFVKYSNQVFNLSRPVTSNLQQNDNFTNKYTKKKTRLHLE